MQMLNRRIIVGSLEEKDFKRERENTCEIGTRKKDACGVTVLPLHKELSFTCTSILLHSFLR